MARISEPAVKITSFDRPHLRILDAKLLAALEGVCKPLGLDVKAVGGRFSEFEFTAKFSITVNSKEATQDKAKTEQQQWELYAPVYGLKPEWFGKEFTSAGKRFNIAGFLPKRSKFPVLAVRFDGKRMLFPVDVVKAKFARFE